MTTLSTRPAPAFTAKRQKDPERTARRSFMGPLVVFLAALSMFPTAFALIASFTDFKLGSSQPWHWVGLDNYASLLTNPEILATFGRTMTILVVALPIQVIVGYLIAKVFYQIRSIPGAGLIRTLYLIPVMLPEIVVGLLFGYMLNSRIGIVNFFLGSLGLSKVDWFGNTNIVLLTITLLIVWQWTPLATIIIYGGLLGIPGEIREAAQIDGAGRLRQVFSLEIPLLRKVIGLVVLLVGIQLIGTFAAVYITTQGGPGSATTVLSYEIYRQAFVFFNTGFGSALSILTLIVVTVLSQLLVRAVFKEEK